MFLRRSPFDPIPHLHGIVCAAAAAEHATIGTPAHAHDVMRVAFEGLSTSLPLAISEMRSCLSAPPLAMSLPSGEKSRLTHGIAVTIRDGLGELAERVLP